MKNAIVTLLDNAQTMTDALIGIATGQEKSRPGKPSLAAVQLYFSLMRDPLFILARRELARRESDNPFDEAFADLPDHAVRRIERVVEGIMEMRVEEMDEVALAKMKDRVVARMNALTDRRPPRARSEG